MTDTLGDMELVKRLEHLAEGLSTEHVVQMSCGADFSDLLLDGANGLRDAARAIEALKADADRRVEEEREACAQIAETCGGDFERDTAGRTERETRCGIAAAIRSRSNATGEDKDGLTAQRTAPSPISQEGSIAPEALSEGE